MDQFLINLEKYRYAILGTVLFHIIIFVVSGFTTVKPVTKLLPEEIRIEIPLDDIELDPELEELLDLKKEPLPTEDVSNFVKDANDTREESFENYSTNKDAIDQEVLNDAKALEAQLFAEAAENNPNKAESRAESDTDIITEDKSKNKSTDKPVETSGGENAIAGEVLVEYDLPGRKAHSLPRPSYMCNSAGTIVIQIKVDASGSVKDTRFLSNRSSGATECLIERATKYAKRARFDYKSGVGLQTGTITYKFMAQ